MTHDIVFRGVLITGAEVQLASYYVELADEAPAYRVTATYHLFTDATREHHLETRDIRFEETAQDNLTQTKMYERISLFLQAEIEAGAGE